MSQFRWKVLRTQVLLGFCLLALLGAQLLVPRASWAEAESAYGPPFLWQIGVQPPSYLFGTIHLPDARVLDLPQSVMDALERADVIYTEIPMDVLSQVEMQRLSMYSGATTLATVLPEALYSRLVTFIESRGVPFFLLSRYKVWAIAGSLPLLDQMRDAGKRVPLDLYLAQWAEARDKETSALETISSQVEVLESMGEAGQIAMLEQTLDYLEKAEASGANGIEDLLLAYLSGDSDRLLALAEQQMDESSSLTPAVKEALIYRRNEQMSETIQRRLREQPDRSHFFAVGVLHYPGPRGILELLEKSGFELERARRVPTPRSSSR